VRTFSIELTQTLEWLTWLLGLSSLDSGPAIGSRPMTAIGATSSLIIASAKDHSPPQSSRVADDEFTTERVCGAGRVNRP